MGERLIRLPEVISRVGLKKSAIYSRIREGSFPKPRPLAANAVAWPESAIDKWVRERIGD